MTTRRWSAQDTYAAEIDAAAATYGIPLSVAYGLIAQESGFNALAYNPEGSYGLCQLLLSTARGLGYSGQPAGLFDVRTNLALGFRFLGDLLRARGSVPAALSSYNGGYRPSLGYGAPRADGTFANQSYVDGVLGKAAYFDSYLAERDGTPASSSAAPTTAGAGGLLGWILSSALVAALLARPNAGGTNHDPR